MNSLHLWSVETFFFFMVIHLWGKFFMAAWRGNRRLTWMTGVVAFVASVATAFTGYLSQQNFDSQWICTQAKDGINATGAGAFLNVLNFGQMLMWHILLLPLGVVVIAGLHVLLVRRAASCLPLTSSDARRPRDSVRRGRGAVTPNDLPHKRGVSTPTATSRSGTGEYVPYDIVKEALRRLVGGRRAILLLAVVFSSPDEPAVTFKSWSTSDPVDFAQTAITELDGTSAVATYGPPYNATPGRDPARSASSSPRNIRRPPARSTPHRTSSSALCGPCPINRCVQRAVDNYEQPPHRTAERMDDRVRESRRQRDRCSRPVAGTRRRYGPVGVMIGSLTTMAQNGGLDGTLFSQGQFYSTNYTKPLLFIADGSYLANLAGAQHLQGTSGA